MTKPKRRDAGMGTVSAYETKAGTRYLIKYSAPTADGERKSILKRGFLTRKAAAAYLGDKTAEVRAGTHIAPKKTTVGAYLDEWLAGLQLAESTRSSYAKNVRLHITPAIGTVQLQSLTGTRISAMYRALEKSGRQDHRAGEGLSPRTVAYIHTILQAALKDAVDQGLVSSNAASKAKPPSARATKSPEIHPWSASQLSAFLGWCQEVEAPHTVAYHVLAFTGARRGEVLALRWRDLSFEEGRLAIRRSVGVIKSKGEPERLVEGPTKSARARTVDLDPDTIDMLKKWRRERGAVSLHLTRDDALIFGTVDGGHLHPERFSRLFVNKQTQCRRVIAGEVPPAIHLHDLRHTHATLLLKAGVPVKVVSERLGHASVVITLEIYAHVMPGMQREAAAMFALAVKGGA